MTSLQKLLNAVRLSKNSPNKSTNSLALSDKPVAQSHNAYAVSESLYSLEAAANGKALVEERPLSHESSLYSKEQPVYSEPDMEHLVYAEVKLDDVKGSKQVSAAGGSTNSNAEQQRNNSTTSSIVFKSVDRQMSRYAQQHYAPQYDYPCEAQQKRSSEEAPEYANCQNTTTEAEYDVPNAEPLDCSYDVHDAPSSKHNSAASTSDQPIYTYADPGYVPLDVPKSLKTDSTLVSHCSDGDKSPVYLPMTSPIDTLQQSPLQNH